MIEINIKLKKIKLNEDIFVNTEIKMNQHQTQTNVQSQSNNDLEYYAMYIRHEILKGSNEFHASVKFLMDENVPKKYKDIYRKNQNQVVEAMDLDEYPEPPKLTRETKSRYTYTAPHSKYNY
jgi:hypothetical protein